MELGIVGGGISGLTLALRAQQLGMGTTLFVDRSPEELRRSRVDNLVARFAATQDRERELGVADWDVGDYASWGLAVDVVGTPLGFRGAVARPVRAVDFRIYLSRLLEHYVDRGGSVVTAPLPATVGDLVERTARHDVVVVAAGRAAPVAEQLFPVRADRSPFQAPQRRLCGGLFTGIAETDPPTVSFNLVPGAGEIFQQPFLTEGGPVSAVLVEAVPGGPLEPITQRSPDGDLAGFADALLDVIDRHAPALAARVDRGRFAAHGERHVLRGAVTPVVRSGWSPLPDGRFALAIGDAWITNDPITGQGANIGSHTAWATAASLAGCDRCDEDFLRALADELWSFAGPVTAWTNAFLLPPPPHILDLLATATAHPEVADAFAAGFADPVRLATSLATPDSCEAFVHQALEPAAV